MSAVKFISLLKQYFLQLKRAFCPDKNLIVLNLFLSQRPFHIFHVRRLSYLEKIIFTSAYLRLHVPFALFITMLHFFCHKL